MGGRGKNTSSSSRRSSERLKAKSKSTSSMDKVDEEDYSPSSASSAKGEESFNSSQQLEQAFKDIQARQAAFFEYDEGIDMSEDEYEIDDYSEIRSAPSLDRFLKGSRLEAVRDSIRAMGLDPNDPRLGIPPICNTPNSSEKNVEHSSESKQSGNHSPKSDDGINVNSSNSDMAREMQYGPDQLGRKSIHGSGPHAERNDASNAVIPMVPSSTPNNVAFATFGATHVLHENLSITTHAAGPLKDHPLQPNLDSHGIHGQNDQAIIPVVPSSMPIDIQSSVGHAQIASTEIPAGQFQNEPKSPTIGAHLTPRAHGHSHGDFANIPSDNGINSTPPVQFSNQPHSVQISSGKQVEINFQSTTQSDVQQSNMHLDIVHNSQHAGKVHVNLENHLGDNPVGPHTNFQQQMIPHVEANSIADYMNVNGLESNLNSISHGDKTQVGGPLSTNAHGGPANNNNNQHIAVEIQSNHAPSLGGGQQSIKGNFSSHDSIMQAGQLAEKTGVGNIENQVTLLSHGVDANSSHYPPAHGPAPIGSAFENGHDHVISPLAEKSNNVGHHAEKLHSSHPHLIDNSGVVPPLHVQLQSSNIQNQLNVENYSNGQHNLKPVIPPHLNHLVGDPFGQNLPAHFNNGLFANLQNEFPPLQQNFSKPAEAHGATQEGFGTNLSSVWGQNGTNGANLITNNWKEHFLGDLNDSLKLDYFDKFEISDGRTIAKPPESVFKEGAQHWNCCLIGQFIGKPPPFFLIRRMVDTQWNKFGHVGIQSNDFGLYVFRFESQASCDRVMQELWHVHHHPLLLRRWEMGLQLININCDRVPMWLKLRNVPLDLLTKDGLSYVSSTIGIPLQMDSKTASRSHLGYARVCVEMNIQKDLPDRTFVEIPKGGLAEIEIDYDWTPLKCSHCNVVGHDTSSCPNSIEEKVNENVTSSNLDWTDARKKSRRRRGASRKVNTGNTNRFNALNIIDEDNGEPSLDRSQRNNSKSRNLGNHQSLGTGVYHGQPKSQKKQVFSANPSNGTNVSVPKFQNSDNQAQKMSVTPFPPQGSKEKNFTAAAGKVISNFSSFGKEHSVASTSRVNTSFDYSRAIQGIFDGRPPDRSTH